MLKETIFAAVGVIVACFIGLFCDRFLTRVVTARPRSDELNDGDSGGGGRQLGTFERLIFFASFWDDDFTTIAGGWLVFKVAAKWAAWEHVAKLPDTSDLLSDRMRLSSKLYGRFVNGTLYNGFCAAVGVVIGRFSQIQVNWMLRGLSDDPLLLFIATILAAGALGIVLISLFCDWPDPSGESPKPRLRRLKNL